MFTGMRRVKMSVIRLWGFLGLFWQENEYTEEHCACSIPGTCCAAGKLCSLLAVVG